jgi:hypothetical protein
MLLIVGCRPRAFFIPALTARFLVKYPKVGAECANRARSVCAGVRSNVHLYRDCRVPAVPSEAQMKQNRAPPGIGSVKKGKGIRGSALDR